MKLILATWNVNSIRARLPNVIEWLREFSPDIVLLQELKCENNKFPAMELEDLGYNLALHGQKTYNGVAILSKYPLEDVVCGLPTLPEDEQARYVEALVTAKGHVVRVASIYVPNGGEVDSDKFQYKLRFLEALRVHAGALLAYDEPVILGADYNVAPADIDVYAPNALRGTTCFHPEEQRRFRALEHLGYTDVFRAHHPDKQAFSWWDYRGGGWEQNKGMRIDHLLLSPEAADKAVECGIDDAPRAKEKASDHAPMWATVALV